MERIEMEKSINKGVPNYIPIELDIATIIRECSDDPDLTNSDFRALANEHQLRIANIAKATKAERAFYRRAKIYFRR